MNSTVDSPAPRWKIVEDELVADFPWPNFVSGLAFVNAVGFLAERNQHHPDIELGYNRVRIRLTTHDAGGITEKDHDLARKINALIDA